MSTNPYAAPNMGASLPPPSRPSDAVRGPAIALIVISSIWLLILVGSLAVSGVLIASGVTERMDRPNPFGISKEVQVASRMGFGLVLIFVHSLVLFGAISMLRMRNLGMAYTAAVLSVIPCCSGCYLVGIPFGIWALVVLNNLEVRERFR